MSKLANQALCVLATLELGRLTDQIDPLLSETDAIFRRAGGKTVGQIERIGETDRLNKITALAAELWRKSLPLAAFLAGEKGISQDILRQTYANAGIFSTESVGASNVASSIIEGHDTTGSSDYHPAGHLKGMLAALRAVM